MSAPPAPACLDQGARLLRRCGSVEPDRRLLHGRCTKGRRGVIAHRLLLVSSRVLIKYLTVTERNPASLLDAHPVRRDAPGHDGLSATETLRELIVIGEIAPGTPLRLEEIAERLGMSISPVREAVRQLEALGLAEHVAYKGAQGDRDRRGRDAGRLRGEARAGVGRPSDALRSGGTRRPRPCSSRPRSSGSRRGVPAAGSEPRSPAATRAFHLALAQASGSRWIPRLLRPMLETSERFSAFVIADDQDEVYEVEERGHSAIVSACRAGDAGGGRADAARAHRGVCRHLRARTSLPTRPANAVAGRRPSPGPRSSRRRPRSRSTYLRTLPFSVSGSSARYSR